MFTSNYFCINGNQLLIELRTGCSSANPTEPTLLVITHSTAAFTVPEPLPVPHGFLTTAGINSCTVKNSTTALNDPSIPSYLDIALDEESIK